MMGTGCPKWGPGEPEPTSRQKWAPRAQKVTRRAHNGLQAPVARPHWQAMLEA